MVQQQCIGSAMKGIHSAKEKVLPCTAAVRLPQLCRKKDFRTFFVENVFLKIVLCIKNWIDRQEKPLLGKETCFFFGHGIQIGDAKALAL